MQNGSRSVVCQGGIARAAGRHGGTLVHVAHLVSTTKCFVAIAESGGLCLSYSCSYGNLGKDVEGKQQRGQAYHIDSDSGPLGEGTRAIHCASLDGHGHACLCLTNSLRRRAPEAAVSYGGGGSMVWASGPLLCGNTEPRLYHANYSTGPTASTTFSFCKTPEPERALRLENLMPPEAYVIALERMLAGIDLSLLDLVDPIPTGFTTNFWDSTDIVNMTVPLVIDGEPVCNENGEQQYVRVCEKGAHQSAHNTAELRRALEATMEAELQASGATLPVGHTLNELGSALQLYDTFVADYSPLEQQQGGGGIGTHPVWRSAAVQTRFGGAAITDNAAQLRWFRIQRTIALFERAAAMQHCSVAAAAQQLDSFLHYSQLTLA